MIYFQSLTQNELAQLLLPLSRHPEKAERQSRYRARQIFHWVYQRFQTDWDQMTDLSLELRTWLKQNIEIFRLSEKQNRQALDGTQKFLWGLSDGKTIESVIIPAALKEKTEMDTVSSATGPQPGLPGLEEEEGIEALDSWSGQPSRESVTSDRWSRLTACISSQVGCAMACRFCLTGVQGLDRHLQVHEIVTQVFELRRLAPITNIVFMGMGEPLHNLQNVIQACRILLDADGLHFSKRKVTVSTSGLVPAIEELGKQVDVSLAISLNATTNEQRSRIMPVNKKWDIQTLLATCRAYPLGKHRRITFEYVLLRDFNDSLEDAARLIELLKGIPSKMNLIPFNPHSGSEFQRPTDEVIRRFQKYLLDRQVTATVRISKGRDILAACGQLRSIFGTARGTERHRDFVESPLPSSV